MAKFWWRLKAQSIPNLETLQAQKSGLVDCGRGLFHANLVRPPNCRVRKQHRTAANMSYKNLGQEYTYEDVVDTVFVPGVEIYESRSGASGADPLDQ
jgi:hypothetical protein